MTKRITINLSDEDATDVVRMAAHMGMPVAAYVAYAVRNDVRFKDWQDRQR